jgi:hypothetical protein
MTKQELRDLLDAFEDASQREDEDFVEELLAAHPCLLNYDYNGNYIGPVSNENGWTP